MLNWNNINTCKYLQVYSKSQNKWLYIDKIEDLNDRKKIYYGGSIKYIKSFILLFSSISEMCS